ncbi:MAG: ATP-binding protein [Bacteroidota bacterium]|nr:ATP-binding protein [Bacteroidota bacterium]
MTASAHLKKHTFRMTIASEPENIHRVETFLRKVKKAERLSNEKYHRLLVVVTEAVNNSITHGNKRNPAHKVHVVCTTQKGVLTVKVRDEGEGFDPRALPDPLHPENLLRESGRGVFLMKQMMDSVSYNETGNEVTMTLRMRNEREDERTRR